MKIHVQAFAMLRDLLGTPTLDYTVPDGCTPAALAVQLLTEKGRPELLALPLRYAIGAAYINADQPLKDGDHLTIIPPVSGG